MPRKLNLLTENHTPSFSRFLLQSLLELPLSLKMELFKRLSLFSITFYNKYKTHLTWKDLLKTSVLKVIKRKETSLLFLFKLLNLLYLMPLLNLIQLKNKSKQLKQILITQMSVLETRLKLVMIDTNNVKRLHKIMKLLDILEIKIELLYLKLSD